MLKFILKLFFVIYHVNCFDFNGRFRYLTREISSMVLETTSQHETRWLKQKLDHFNESENRTWKMRYFERPLFWRANGPIYLFIGGESEASPGFLYSGVVYELAKETNGAMYASEHRYYGQSVPVKGTSVDNFKYLSGRQALADNAHLLRTIKSLPLFADSKVVVIGGSYAGNLAAWMKLLYPELVDAVIASSAPVLAKKDFYEYLETVNDVYAKYGTKDCLETIKQNFKRYETLFETPEGIEQLKKEENVCPSTDMSILENKQLFFLDKASVFMGNTQYGKDSTIKDHCEKINKTQESSHDEPYIWDEKQQCIDYDFNNFINNNYKDRMDFTTCWTYQTCTEYGYLQSTSSNKQPFTHNIPLEFHVKFCTKTFGSEFNDTEIEKGIENVNNMYGGLNPNVTKVVFVNGDMDPWSKLSVLKDISSYAPAIVIPRSSHCRDLFSNREGDHEELKQARQKIKDLIKGWI